MNMRLQVPALALALGVSLAPAAWAQGAPIEAPPAPAAPAKATASVTGAATRGITLKLATTTVSMAVYYLGTGSLATSGAVTAINAVTSYALYVGNEYMWDTLSPPPRPTEAGETFKTTTSAWRNTLKFLTFKPAVTLSSWAALYGWTGSMATSLTYGGVLAVIMPGVFYGNNVAWDWYDWYAARPAEPPPPTRRTFSLGSDPADTSAPR